MANDTQPASPRRRDRVLGMTARTAGVVGIVISFAVIIGVLFGRAWLIDRVDGLEGTIDGGIAQGVSLVDGAAARVDDVSTQIGELADAAEARAAEPGAGLLVQAVLERTTGVSDRYLALRSSYFEAREKVIAALDRLNTIDRLVPIVDIPQGPVDALAALDERVLALDAGVMELADAVSQLGSDGAATAIAERAGNVEATLNDVSARLGDASARLDDLRADVASTADTFRTLFTLGAIVLILAFLYSALLHWVLYRSGSQLGRDGGGS